MLTCNKMYEKNLTYIHVIVVYWLQVSLAKIKIISILDDGGSSAVATCTPVTPQI